MNERYKYLKSAQAKPDDNALWKLYKIKRNSVKKMLRKAEAQYWIKLPDNASTPKDFWKISNQILDKSTNTRIGSLQDTDGNIITDEEQKSRFIEQVVFRYCY